MLANDPYICLFSSPLNGVLVPEQFTNPFCEQPHPLAQLAAKELQSYLMQQQDWEHNFGLQANQAGKIIGKMFGVLVVKNYLGELGYIAAFSGKLAGSNQHPKFVPPVYDALEEGSFLNKGMQELTRIIQQIKALEKADSLAHAEQIKALKIHRKAHSIALQTKLFQHYIFINQAREEKSLFELFQTNRGQNPPSGAGECTAPKLLQYAFLNNLQPVTMTEFWWGQSPKSTHWVHGTFYPACQEKCAPILSHMLEGLPMDSTSKKE